MRNDKTEIRQIKRRALSLLTEDGKKRVEQYVAKIWNDDNLSRAAIEAIACALLLRE